MFDLIEQDLSQQEQSPKPNEADQVGPGDISDSISILPERFRPIIKKKKKGNVLVIVVIVLFMFVAIGSIVVLLLMSNPQQKINKDQSPASSTDQTEEVVEEKNDEEVQNKNQTETEAQNATSTSAVVEVTPEVKSEETQESVREIPQEAPEVNATAAPSEPLRQGVDSDGDGLTDTEERMYGTNTQLPDSDSDGFFDGEELKKLFDPIRGNGALLDISPLVHSYTNTAFKYRLLYPASWVAKAINATEREVLLTSSTGEFISLHVEDNIGGITPLEWYVTIKEPGSNPAQLQTISGTTWNGVVSANGRTIYFVRRGDASAATVPLMYSLTYNLNTKNEVNFLTTFQMMISSFTFTDLTFVK